MYIKRDLHIPTKETYIFVCNKNRPICTSKETYIYMLRELNKRLTDSLSHEGTANTLNSAYTSKIRQRGPTFSRKETYIYTKRDL